MENVKPIGLSYFVFVGSLLIVGITLMSLLFPAFLLTVGGSESEINSFELGAWVTPFLSINISLLVFGILYYKQLLPEVISKSFRFILRFEVSPKVTKIVFSLILGFYILFAATELNDQEVDVWHDWLFLGPVVENFPYGLEDQPVLSINYVKNFLLFSSQEIFQNVKIIPFIGTISLIFVTYFLTVQISGKRFAGLVAVIILLQSQTFLRYDTTATFSNFWVLFYLVSIYLINKKWYLSPLAFIASIFSKSLTITFLPMTLFFILRSEISKNAKIRVTIFYLIILIAIVIGLFLFKDVGFGDSVTPFEFDEFLSGFTAWAYQLRIDSLMLVFLLPLVVGLFIKSYQGFRQADSIMVLIAGILLTAPLLSGFSEFNIQPYRWMPLITFFAIGIGVLLSKKSDDGSVN